MVKNYKLVFVAMLMVSCYLSDAMNVELVVIFPQASDVSSFDHKKTIKIYEMSEEKKNLAMMGHQRMTEEIRQIVGRKAYKEGSKKSLLGYRTFQYPICTERHKNGFNFSYTETNTGEFAAQDIMIQKSLIAINRDVVYKLSQIRDPDGIRLIAGFFKALKIRDLEALRVSQVLLEKKGKEKEEEEEKDRFRRFYYKKDKQSQRLIEYYNFVRHKTTVGSGFKFREYHPSVRAEITKESYDDFLEEHNYKLKKKFKGQPKNPLFHDLKKVFPVLNKFAAESSEESSQEGSEKSTENTGFSVSKKFEESSESEGECEITNTDFTINLLDEDSEESTDSQKLAKKAANKGEEAFANLKQGNVGEAFAKAFEAMIVNVNEKKKKKKKKK